MPEKAVVKEASLPPVQAPQSSQAMVTFLSGEVYHSPAGDWLPAEIGQLLDENESLKVGKESYCELQFGNMGALRVQENTQILLKDVLISPEGSTVGVKMTVGTIVAKVSKLGGGDSFSVSTPSAVCGVRGTEFSVKTYESGDTRLAVKTGKVAVLPTTVDLQDLKQKAEARDERLGAQVEKLEEAAPQVAADQEVLVTVQDKQRSEQSFQQVAQTLQQIIDTPSDKAVPAQSITRLTGNVEAASHQAATAVEPPRQLTTESTETLKALEKVKLVEIPVAPVATAAQPRPEAAPEVRLEKISIQALPVDTDIYLDQDLIGKGRFSGLFSPGENLTFRLIRDGYQEQTLSFTVTKGSGRIIEVGLMKSPTASVPAPASTPPAAPPAVAAIPTPPPVAATAALPRPAAATQPAPAPAPRPAAAAGPAQAEPPIQAEWRVSEHPLIGNLLVSGDRLYTADRTGKIFCVNRRGQTLWSIPTKNSPNENYSPIMIGSNLFLTGADELVIANAASGTVLTRMDLEKDYSHIFGRRVAAFRQSVLFPTNRTLRLINPHTAGVMKEVAVPGGSRMTPLVHQGKAMIVNQEGVFTIIDLERGRVEASLPTGAIQPIAINMVVFAERAYFGDRKGRVVCVSLPERKVLWERVLRSDLERGIYQDLEAGPDGVFAFSEGVLYGFSRETGEELFPPIRNVSCPPLYRENPAALFLGTSDGRFLMTDVAGRILKELPLGEAITTRPRLVSGPKDKVMVGTERGRILTIEPALIP